MPLKSLTGPYALWIELIDTRSKDGQRERRNYSDEVSWGSRHSSELGVLELVSLRINKALLESSSDGHWGGIRPVVRIRKRQELERDGTTNALWYRVLEVAGEDFDNR
jgi:predicted outer membrane lipoprotein